MLLRVAWLAILLGLGMQALLLGVQAATANLPGVGALVADFSRTLCWSVIVCVGLAVGTAASSARTALMGLAGLLAAPVAFTAARIVQQTVAEVLEASGSVAGQPSVLILALLKAMEYGCLGAALGWLGRKHWGGAVAHAAAGLLAGLVFGGSVLVLSVSGTGLVMTGAMLARAVNEILFPVGCALTIFAAEHLGRRLAGATAPARI